MNHVVPPGARKRMTGEEFLAWEAKQDRKWEFDGFEPVAMNGGTVAHSAITGNLLTALNIRLRGKPCRPHGPDLKVRTGRSYRYPDALVSCSAIPLDADAAVDPVVIFEVLSSSTSADDRTTKLAEYQALPSVMHYVLLEQDRAFVTVLSRSDGPWRHTLLGPDGVLALPEIGVELPVAELYEGLAFPQPEG